MPNGLTYAHEEDMVAITHPRNMYNYVIYMMIYKHKTNSNQIANIYSYTYVHIYVEFDE